MAEVTVGKTVVITLTSDEADKLSCIVGSILGDGPLRFFCNDLYSQLVDVGAQDHTYTVKRSMEV